MPLSPYSLRRLLEKISRRLVFRRRLPTRFGGAVLWVSPGAALGYYRPLNHRNWRELYDFAEHCVHRDATVWDIGANLGIFAFAAAHIAGPNGHVLAVEADPWLADLMRRSARIPQRRARVDVLCAAAARTVDLLSFEITERTRSGSHLSAVSGASAELVGHTCEVHPVIAVSLDWLCEHLPPPNVLKMDIEGAEYLVLQGAERLLAASRPVILLEVHEVHADAVTTLLHGHNYVLFDFTQGWEGRRMTERATYNTLAVPKESSV